MRLRPRHDVKGAVGPQQHERIALAEHDPLSVGRESWEVVALSVVGRPRQRGGLTAFAVIEGDAIDVVAELLAAFEELRYFLPRDKCRGGVFEVGQLIALAAGKKDRLAVGTPHGIALHILAVVGALERKELLRSAGRRRPGCP